MYGSAVEAWKATMQFGLVAKPITLTSFHWWNETPCVWSLGCWLSHHCPKEGEYVSYFMLGRSIISSQHVISRLTYEASEFLCHANRPCHLRNVECIACVDVTGELMKALELWKYQSHHARGSYWFKGSKWQRMVSISHGLLPLSHVEVFNQNSMVLAYHRPH